MEETVFFWSGWEPIIRILTVGTTGYLALVILLRFSGKRTLSRMTAFDFVIAITIGSAFGRILSARNVSLSESVTVFLLLVMLQIAFSFLELVSGRFRKCTTSPPRVLYHRGKFFEKEMKKALVTRMELLAAARKKGFGAMEEIEAIVFESDGSFSVMRHSDAETSTYKQLLP